MIILILAFLLWTPFSVWATDRYVDGSATGCGTSSTTYDPSTRACGSGLDRFYSTLNAACSAMAGGDAMIVRAGTYTSMSSLQGNCIPSGTAGNPTYIKAYTGERPVMQPSSGGTGAGFIWIQSKNYITIQGFDINCASCGTLGIFNFNGTTISSNIIITDNWIHGTSQSGVLIGCTSCTISYNKIYNNGRQPPNTNGKFDHGIYLSAGSNTQIIYNEIYNNTGWGIQNYPAPIGTIIMHNYIHDNQTGGTTGQCPCGEIVDSGDSTIISYNIIKATGTSSSLYGNTVGSADFGTSARRNVKVEQNVIRNGNVGMRFGASTGMKLYNNFIIGATTALSDSSTALDNQGNITTGTPSNIWVDPTNNDYSLKLGSSGIDAGVDKGNAFNGSAPDVGPFETFVFATCQVPNGAASTVQVTFTNNLAPPLLPTSGVTGFSFRKNAVANAVVSTAKIGDNIIKFTLTNAYVGGDTVDFSVTTSNVTDSSLIGNQKNQSYVQTLTNQSCTNNAGGAPTYTFTQSDYEWHGFHGVEASPEIKPDGAGSAGAAENYTRMSIYPCGHIRLRISVKCGVATCPATAFYLYNSIDNGSSYSLVPDSLSTNNIMFCGNSAPSDVPSNGTATTNQLSTTGTFVAGGFIRTSNAIPTIASMASGDKTELEFCINFGPSATGTYLFQLRKQDGSVLDSYSHTPSLTISNVFGGSGF